MRQILMFAAIALASQANAQAVLDRDNPKTLIFRSDQPNLVCLDIRSQDGVDATLLVTALYGKKTMRYEAIATSGRCFHFKGKGPIEVFGTALVEPVIVRVGPSRNALKGR